MKSTRRLSINSILKKNVHLLEGKIADFGGSTNNVYKSKNIVVLNSDPSTSPDICCDLENIPVDKENFDSFLFLETLEHVKNPTKVLKEINRTLKNGANGIISVPFIYQYHPSPIDHRRWTEDKLKIELLKCNFEVKKIYYNSNLLGVISDLIRSYLLNFYPRNILYKIIYNLFKPLRYILNFLDKRIPKYNNITTGYTLIVKKVKYD